MSGQIILVQKRISLNYSNLALGVVYEFVHTPALSVVHAREIILNARVSQRNIGGTASASMIMRGFYPDPDDASDVVGSDLLTIDLEAAPAAVPGIATATQVNNIPAWIRIISRFTQASGTAVAITITMSVEVVVRE